MLTSLKGPLCLLLVGFLAGACSDGDDGEAPTCAEPEFVPNLAKDYAPCGCTGGAWAEACMSVDFGCWSIGKGNICSRRCDDTGACPPFNNWETSCVNAWCLIPCDEGGGCPDGMVCNYLNQCLWNTDPEPEATS